MPMAIFILFALLAFSQAVLAVPPPSVTCKSGNFNCTVTGTYGVWPDRSSCNAAQVMYPRTEQEIVNAVAFGARNNLKMKVVTRLSHSIPKLVCPGGNQGLIISTRDYNSKVTIDKASMLVTVDSGMELHDFVKVLAESDLAFPHSPYWSGVTMGGMLSTGAHGSSLTGLGSAVHEYVDRIRLVVPATAAEGYAKVLTLNVGDRDLDAVKVSLGVLGVLSEITLRVQPMFKRSVRNTMRSDNDLEQVIATFANGNEFGDISWFPSFRQAVYRSDVRVPQTTRGNGLNDFIGFQPTATFVTEALRTTEELFEATGNTAGICARAELQARTLFTLGNGLKNDGFFFTGYPLIGNQSRIQASGRCIESSNRLQTCPWDYGTEGIFFHQTTVSISLDKAKDFITDMKTLRNISSSANAGLCVADAYNGVLIRYVRSSTAYLGKPSDSVDIDITYYRADDAKTPRLNEDILEEIEQMAVFKYGGTPHWGKNRNVAFLNVTSKYPKLPEFLEVKQRLDPAGLFSSEWSDAVLGVPGNAGLTTDANYCALEGLCICSQDRHCAPEKGYFCTPGKVFKAARVCSRRT